MVKAHMRTMAAHWPLKVTLADYNLYYFHWACNSIQYNVMLRKTKSNRRKDEPNSIPIVSSIWCSPKEKIESSSLSCLARLLKLLHVFHYAHLICHFQPLSLLSRHKCKIKVSVFLPVSCENWFVCIELKFKQISSMKKKNYHRKANTVCFHVCHNIAQQTTARDYL